MFLLTFCFFINLKWIRKIYQQGSLWEDCHFISMDLKSWRIFLYFPPEHSHYGKINCHSRDLHSQVATGSTDILLCFWFEELHLRSRLMFLRLWLNVFVLLFLSWFWKNLKDKHWSFLYLVGCLEYPWVWVSNFDGLFINLYSWVPCSFRLFPHPTAVGFALGMVSSRNLRSKLPMYSIRIDIIPFIDYLISLGIKIYQIHMPIS